MTESSTDSFVFNLMLQYANSLAEVFEKNPNEEITAFQLSTLSSGERLKLAVRMKKEIKSWLAEHAGESASRSHLHHRIHMAVDMDSMINSGEFARFIVRNLQTTCPKIFKTLRRRLLKALKKKLDRVGRREPQASKQSIKWRAEQLFTTFNLNKLETELFIFFFIFTEYDGMKSAFSSEPLHMNELRKSIRNYCRFFKVRPQQLRDALKKDSRLIRSGLITRTKERRNEIGVRAHVSDYLAGITEGDLNSEYLDTLSPNAELDLGDFGMSKSSIESIKALLKSPRPTSLLLHGVPGTGKTAFAKSMACHLGLDLIAVKQTDADGEENLDYRKTGLVGAQRFLLGQQAILLIDECDPIINTKSGLFDCDSEDGDEKSWINHYIETNQLKTIWISNKSDGVDESTKRRFSFAQEFREPGKAQRLKAWQIQTEKQKANFVDKAKMEEYASKYKLSPGSISLAIQDVVAMPLTLSDAKRLNRLESILGKQEEFIHGRSKKLSGLQSNYSLENLNTDQPLAKITENLRNFLEADGKTHLANLNLLLMGAPGTGKTEYVKYLANTCGRELIVKRTSDLISKWVGESEKNIAQAFSEAEDKDAILFFDEADSLFINRSSAVRSWEVSQTNELLTQMENFKGVLVCATNFHENLDGATLRRFAYKIKFGYLEPKAIREFYQRAFSTLLDSEMSASEAERLQRLKMLTPGDFKVVSQQHLFEKSVPHAELISDLEREEANKKQAGRGGNIVGIMQ